MNTPHRRERGTRHLALAAALLLPALSLPALAKDPASPLLLNLLQNTAQQEIQLYTSVNESTDPILMRRT